MDVLSTDCLLPCLSHALLLLEQAQHIECRLTALSLLCLQEVLGQVSVVGVIWHKGLGSVD